MHIQRNQIADTVRNLFNFNVVKKPLSAVTKSDEINPIGELLETPCYGLFREDTGQYVGGGSVSDRYEPHTTDDVIALVESAANAFDDDVQLTASFDRGHFIEVAPSNERRIQIHGEHDNVFPRMIISAGYNSRPFASSIGFYRDLCSNLAMLESVEDTSVSIRHTRSLRDKMDDLIEIFNGLRDGWSTLTDTIKHMNNREVHIREFLLDIYGTPSVDAEGNVSSRSRTMHENRIYSIMKRWHNERHRSGREILKGSVVSAWEAYNAVQGHAQHDASRKGGDKTNFQRALLAARDPHVKAAERLAIAA